MKKQKKVKKKVKKQVKPKIAKKKSIKSKPIKKKTSKSTKESKQPLKQQIKKPKLKLLKKPVILIILDGWGYRKDSASNAVVKAKTPNFINYQKNNPHTHLNASGEYVGLPNGYIGNSEVGHEHLGAGRYIEQDLSRINKEIKSKKFFRNKALLETIEYVKKNGTSLHLMGLCSDGGVHSHLDHLFALLELAKKYKLKKVYIHVFTDGRDVSPKSALDYIDKINKKTKRLRIGEIATVIGRYYSMDRDNRWGREHKAYNAMVNGFGLYFDSAEKAVKEAYKRGETDEFIQPSIVFCNKCDTKHTVQEKDAIIFFNFREDRAREITRAFVQGEFREFKRKKLIRLHFTSLTQYDSRIKTKVAYPPQQIKNSLAEILANKKVRQFRLAETEKYAHVTYFFNCGREKPFPKEDRIVVPSPKVATYDLKPEMNASIVKEIAKHKIESEEYKFILINFANPDMVGHSGKLQQTIEACEAIDEYLGEVIETAIEHNYAVIITADHGNAEEMSGKFKTSHTLNKVPFILVNYNSEIKLNNDKNNSLANIAPTVLKIMGYDKPKEMFKGLF
ncbi:2,3-bisphosphoglycerate-independent phosphoglycerate mutase [Nanoarchaeota archaeon]